MTQPENADIVENEFRKNPKIKIFANIMTFFAISMLLGKATVGALHIGKCEVQLMIPVYLIVPLNMFGCIALFCCFYWNTSWRLSEHITTSVAILGLLSLGWLIAGSAWVFPIWRSIGINGCDSTTSCCNILTLKMAFGITMFDWLALVLSPVVLLTLKHYLKKNNTVSVIG